MENQILFMAVKDNKVIEGMKGQYAFGNRTSLVRSLSQKAGYNKNLKGQYQIIEFSLEDILRGQSEFWRDELEIK